MVAQPGAKRLRVVDSRFPKAEQGAYLGALALRRAVGSIRYQRCAKARLWHAKAVRQLRHRGPAPPQRLRAEITPGTQEQHNDRETPPVGQPLRLTSGRSVRVRSQTPS